MSIRGKITVTDIRKSYRMYKKPTDRVLEAMRLTRKPLHVDFWALDGISFTLEPGRIMGIMGRNGSGKSTLLKIITGVVTPTSGQVAVDGKVSSLLELGAGFNMEYTGMENIFFYCTLMGMGRDQIRERLDEIVGFAEIGDYIYQPVKTYSSGMFARLAFSCAINVQPDILIVDEILSVGDIRFQAKCFSKFKEFKTLGVTILYVGHDIGLMRTFCDTCMWLNCGKVVDIGEPVYISSKYTEFMYLDDSEELTGFHIPESPQEVQKTIEEDGTGESEGFEKARESGRPLTHWGSRMGLIRDVRLTNAHGDLVDHFAPGDMIAISFHVHADTDIDTANLSIAFSIKNREGLDLIVGTTYDEGVSLAGKRNFLISFKLKSLLNSGEYYLVLAAENRENAVISYYEYIEGAKYFKVFAKDGLFGVYLTDVDIEITEKGC